jgi:hypothetical protein
MGLLLAAAAGCREVSRRTGTVVDDIAAVTIIGVVYSESIDGRLHERPWAPPDAT